MGIRPDSEFASRATLFSPSAAGLRLKPLESASALVLHKGHVGFNAADIVAISEVSSSLARGEGRGLKFLVIDFAHDGEEWARAPDDFSGALSVNAELIVDSPIITVAWARCFMSGRDLEFAMSCSIFVAERGARFSFGGDPFDLFGLYTAVGRRIGFVRTERLIENDAPYGAEEMRELMIVKDVVEPRPGDEGIAAYLGLVERRYNAAHAIYRAQRLAEARVLERSLS